MKVAQSFSGGLDQDSDKSIPRKNTYLSATNLRLNTDSGQSKGALQNVNGNLPFGDIPDTAIVYKVISNNLDPVQDSTFSVTINGTTVALGTAYAETLENIVDYINDNFASNFGAYLSPDESYFLFTSTDGTSITTFTITLSGGRTVTISTLVAAQTDLIPIGWTTIRDEIIILTTSETTASPTTSAGQIWKLTYDEITLAETFTLLYNNIINFTTFHPVPPTAITSRYENANTKRIYWTDNYNQLRSFNTADPNGFIIDPTLLDLQSSVDGSIPILQSITTGGTTLVGMYQAAYRLKNNSSITTFSEVSNNVYLVEKSEQEAAAGTNPETYVGADLGTLAGKTINWEIKNLDTDFDRIEIVILFYDSYNSAPVVRVTHDEPIPDNGTFSFRYSGNELLEEITINAYLLQTFAFTHAKTLATKDNRLIVANTRNELVDFDFDARAYRFTNTNTTLDLLDSQGNMSSFLIPTGATTEWDDIPETYDAINPDQLTYKYQRNTSTIGGVGPYISYTFGTFCVKGDSTVEINNTQGSPFATTNPRYNTNIENLGVTDQDYPMNSSNDGMRFAYRSGLFKGYQRNETYRFAIEFFDLQSRPLFSRWIGDIRMPDYNDVNSNPDPIATVNGITADFRLSWDGTSSSTDEGVNASWLNILYIRFVVTVPTSIRQYVSGYRIVRVERTKDDKSVIGAGILTQMVNDGSSVLSNPTTHVLSLNGVDTTDMNIATGGWPVVPTGGFPYRKFTFDSPDFLLTGFPGTQSEDSLSPAITLGRATNQTIVDTTPGTETEPYRIIKTYNNVILHSFDDSTFTIDQGGEVGYNNSFYFTTGAAFSNFSTGNLLTTFPSIGTKTVVLSLNANLDYSGATYACTANSDRKLYCLYTRSLGTSTTSTQYGGASYSARSTNEYIPCGSYQPLLQSDSTSVFTHKVFGGDIYLDFYDHQKLVKNFFSLSGRDLATAGVTQNSFSIFFPCESSHNMNLRHGIHINKDLWKNGGLVGGLGHGYGASASESYDYNLVYSSENNSRTYITKPIDFLAVEEQDTRIWVSEEKQNGEAKDSWKQFLPANYYDAESYNGPINAIIAFRDKIFFLQDTGFGIVPINDRTLVSSNEGQETNIGSPLEIIQRPEYISRTIGCKHQWGVTTSDNAIYFFDINSKQLFQFSQGLSPIGGLSGYFKDNLVGTVITYDNPVYETTTRPRAGINCTTDFRNNDVLFTFFDFTQTVGGFLGQGSRRKFTIAYNEEFKCFTSFYDFQPILYINNRKKLITPSSTSPNELWIHEEGAKCSFYGTVYDSTVKILVNPDANKSKLFTNLEWLTQSINTSDVNVLTDTWKEARVYNDYQNTDTKTLTVGTNVKRNERGWRYAIPRNIIKATGGSTLDIFNPVNFNALRLFKEPIRDMYMTVDLTYENTSNNKLIFPFLVTDYLVSPR